MNKGKQMNEYKIVTAWEGKPRRRRHQKVNKEKKRKEKYF